LNLIDGLRRVDWNGDGADAENRQIGDRPFGPVLGNQRHAIAGADAEVAEAERDAPHAAHKLFGRDAHPLVAALFADRVRFIVPGNSLQTQSRQSRWRFALRRLTADL